MHVCPLCDRFCSIFSLLRLYRSLLCLREAFVLESGNNGEKEKSENPYAKPSLTEFEFQLKLNKQTFGCAGTKSAKTEG